jgi:hypothetical protein
MRGITIVGLAFVAAIGSASTALAGNGWDGFVDVGGSWEKLGISGPGGMSLPPGFSITGWSGDFRAMVARDFPSMWGVQVDGVLKEQVIRVSSGGMSDEESASTGDVALHVYRREQGRFLFGGIFQYGGDLSDLNGDNHIFAGVEG